MSAVVEDELELLAELVDLHGAQLVELGCGAAGLARELLRRFPGAHVTGLEVDQRQHARNVAQPQPGLKFVQAGAEAIPCEPATFDGALMLKSLHHVPEGAMARALAEAHRVLKPGGWLYVSEPVYDGEFNELVRLFNDEGEVRAAAQRALDDAVASGRWEQAAERRFMVPVRFRDFADFEQRMMRPSWADHPIDEDLLRRVAERYARYQAADGAAFTRPMHVRVLRRRP